MEDRVLSGLIGISGQLNLSDAIWSTIATFESSDVL